SIQTPEPHTKKAFPYHMTIHNVVFNNPKMPFSFSSLEPEKNKNIGSSSLLLNNIYLINRSFPFAIRDNELIIDSLTIQNEIGSQMKAWEIKEDIAQNAEKNIYLNIKRLIGTFYPVDLHTSDHTKDGSQKYTLLKKHGDHATCNMLDTSFHFNHEGKITVNQKTLLVSNTEQKFTHISDNSVTTLKVRTNTEEPKESKINSEYTDLVVMSSFMSESLYSGADIDSSKVMHYVEKLDSSPFRENSALLQNKLSLLQRINNYAAYNEACANVPVSALAGTHHLNNILSRDPNISNEKFSQIVPLMYDNRRNDWFQNSFFQFIKSEGPVYEEKLNMLSNELPPEINTMAYPMSLWYTATKANNPGKNVASVQELLALDKESWTKGNAGRYALLLYKDILRTDSLRSKSVLDGIIHKLEQVYGDTDGEEKKITKWFLSTAYYFAYQTNKDSDNAVLLLEKAADYSPLTEKELAYSSNYDVVFLKGKKSYKEEYLDVLSSTQDKAIVLQHYVQNFLTSHANGYEALRNFYLNKYAGEDFSIFFTEQVLPQLDNAPAFALNDLTNHKQTLENFKGKWTLVDFWGTWCGPCVAEMPKLNAFHEELKKDDSKSQKINFLTIACHDTEEKVKNFLAANDYNIPVLMSDGEVQKHYNVAGYPSKYIISPEGKLIAIPFGFDWQPLLESLASL